MKHLRKKIALMIVCVMVMSIVMMQMVLANDEGAFITVSDSLGKVGDQVVVMVNLNDIPSNLAAIEMEVTYDKDKLKPAKMEDTGMLSGYIAAQKDVTQAEGVFRLSWGDGLGTIPEKTTGTIAKITFEILESFTEKMTVINVSVVDAFNSEVEYVEIASGSGEVTLEQPVHEHSFGEWRVVTSPKCEAEGSRVRSCEECGYWEEEKIPPLGHTPGEWSTEKEATCTEAGLKVKYCTVCNEKVKEEIINALGHLYGEWEIVTAPGINKEGLKKRTCTLCGNVEMQKIDAIIHGELDHVFNGKQQVLTEATCTQNGVLRTYCSFDGCDAFHDEAIEAKGHMPGEWITEKEATCTENGLKVKYCTVCNEEYAREVTDVLGHDYSDWKVTKEAAIGVDGEEERVCSRCNEKETRVIPAIIHGEDDHTFDGKTEVIEEADCTSDGVKRIYCSFKGCSAYKEIPIPATGHSFDVWTVVKEPTCTEKGRKESVCSLCQDKKSDDIPALGHAYSDWQTVKEPTFHEDGLQKRVCENCGDELEAVLPKLSEGHEHDFSGEQILIKEATCTEPGLVNVRCSNPECEAVKEIQIAKKGHSFGEWTVVKNAEVGVKGIKERQCTVCGDKENMEIPEVPQTEPVILKGQNGNWTQESEAGLSFRSDALFVHFVSVSVDGNVIDAENYMAREGSTIIELKPEYLATLSAGEHSISINSLNGSATTKFVIKVKSVVDSDTPKLETADKNSETEKVTSVKTGDNTHMSVWFLLLIVSGTSIVMVLFFSKKKRRIG